MYFFTVGNSKILIFVVVVMSKGLPQIILPQLFFLSFSKRAQKKIVGKLKLTKKIILDLNLEVSWWVGIKQIKI